MWGLMKKIAHEKFFFALITLVGAIFITRGLVAQPGYTDAFYHANAANRLLAGAGLTDPYLWTYLYTPADLPIPSHLYWMPMTSLLAAAGMWLFNAPASYAAAQSLFTGLFILTVGLGYTLGARLGGTPRHAWVAGLLTLCSGFFIRFWGATDTFAPYALFGALCLLCIGEALRRGSGRWHALAGVFAALGHLTRADGLLLLVVGWLMVGWEIWRRRITTRQAAVWVALLTSAYVVVMLPWFMRNLSVIGSPLPLGGTQGIWYTVYDDIFNYPAQASPQTLFANGLGAFFESRWLALTNNLGTFVAVEGLVVMTPLMLLGVWQRREDAFVRCFAVYALGLHVAMTLVFPFPGYRGGLLHSAAALVPGWAALGVVGLDAAVDIIARYRRTWKPRTAKRVFSVGLVALALFLSVFTATAGRVGSSVPTLYTMLHHALPDDARVMINDPAQLYYYTGLSGVVLPNAPPEAILDIARRYQVTYLLLESTEIDGQTGWAVTAPLLTIPAAPPSFLVPVPFEHPNARLYAIKF